MCYAFLAKRLQGPGTDTTVHGFSSTVSFFSMLHITNTHPCHVNTMPYGSLMLNWSCKLHMSSQYTISTDHILIVHYLICPNLHIPCLLSLSSQYTISSVHVPLSTSSLMSMSSHYCTPCFLPMVIQYHVASPSPVTIPHHLSCSCPFSTTSDIPLSSQNTTCPVNI